MKRTIFSLLIIMLALTAVSTHNSKENEDVSISKPFKVINKQELQGKIESLEAENKEFRDELDNLKKLLNEHNFEFNSFKRQINELSNKTCQCSSRGAFIAICIILIFFGLLIIFAKLLILQLKAKLFKMEREMIEIKV
jgi:septal ring factor EnvC (AmiA/AmiB activator)